MGKKSSAKPTSKKKSTSKKRDPASNKTVANNNVTAKPKTTAKPKAKKGADIKKAVGAQKKISLKKLVLRQFDAWEPGNIFRAAPEHGEEDFSAPPFVSDEKDAVELRALLSRVFDFKDFSQKETGLR